MNNGTEQIYVDPVEEASVESFPASDAPGWVSLRSGEPSRLSAAELMSHAERVAWNRALEAAAVAIEGGSMTRQELSAEIRSMKHAVGAPQS